MPLDRLLEEIRARSTRDLSQETERANSERERIVNDRDQRIAQARDETARRTSLEVTRERVQRLAAAKLEARKRQFEAQEGVVEASLGQARTLLADFASSGAYAGTLERMYRAASTELGAGVRVRGRAEDASHLKRLAGSGFVAEPLPISGGLVAESADGSRRLNLSFDELLRLRQDRVLTLLRRAG